MGVRGPNAFMYEQVQAGAGPALTYGHTPFSMSMAAFYFNTGFIYL